MGTAHVKLDEKCVPVTKGQNDPKALESLLATMTGKDNGLNILGPSFWNECCEFSDLKMTCIGQVVWNVMAIIIYHKNQYSYELTSRTCSQKVLNWIR